MRYFKAHSHGISWWNSAEVALVVGEDSSEDTVRHTVCNIFVQRFINVMKLTDIGPGLCCISKFGMYGCRGQL